MVTDLHCRAITLVSAWRMTWRDHSAAGGLWPLFRWERIRAVAERGWERLPKWIQMQFMKQSYMTW